MRSFLSRVVKNYSRYRSQLFSLAAHLCLLLCFVGGLRRSAKVVPFRLPGTAQGVTTLTYFSPGSLQPRSSEAPLKRPEKTASTPSLQHTAEAPRADRSPAIHAEAGVGTAAQSGIGEGDITIALQTYFPYPTPDLSGLPRGTKGDVILNAVIDEHGKIAELTLLKGLGSPVDETVIATVQQWTYTPAMKNGVPVVSEQELHFHYERG
jgi:protein TonB